MLKTRILTALVLLPLMLSALFLFPQPLWAAFAWLICGLALWEFTRMTGIDGIRRKLYLLFATLLALWCAQSGIGAGMPLHIIVLAFWLLVVPAWMARRWIPGGSPVLAGALGLLLMFPAWLAMVALRPDPAHGWRLLAIMGLVWVADVAAYFAGKAFGRHKLAPAISPGKSREGVAGAVVAVALYTLIVASAGWLALPVSTPVLLAISVPLTAVSVYGDLLESWFKRCAGIKDSSALLPGHGGVYDRIDSLVAVLAVSHALLGLCGL